MSLANAAAFSLPFVGRTVVGQNCVSVVLVLSSSHKLLPSVLCA